MIFFVGDDDDDQNEARTAVPGLEMQGELSD